MDIIIFVSEHQCDVKISRQAAIDCCITLPAERPESHCCPSGLEEEESIEMLVKHVHCAGPAALTGSLWASIASSFEGSGHFPLFFSIHCLNER